MKDKLNLYALTTEEAETVVEALFVMLEESMGRFGDRERLASRLIRKIENPIGYLVDDEPKEDEEEEYEVPF